MKILAIGCSHLKGTSKTTGKDFDFKVLSVGHPQTDFKGARRCGFYVKDTAISDAAFEAAASLGFPCMVDVTVEVNLGGGKNLITAISPGK